MGRERKRPGHSEQRGRQPRLDGGVQLEQPGLRRHNDGPAGRQLGTAGVLVRAAERPEGNGRLGLRQLPLRPGGPRRGAERSRAEIPQGRQGPVVEAGAPWGVRDRRLRPPHVHLDRRAGPGAAGHAGHRPGDPGRAGVRQDQAPGPAAQAQPGRRPPGREPGNAGRLREGARPGLGDRRPQQQGHQHRGHHHRHAVEAAHRGGHQVRRPGRLRVRPGEEGRRLQVRHGGRRLQHQVPQVLAGRAVPAAGLPDLGRDLDGLRRPGRPAGA